MKYETFQTLAAIAVCIVMLSVVSSMSLEDENLEKQAYCLNVELWELDQSRGVAPTDRKGHPNFNKLDCKAIVENPNE